MYVLSSVAWQQQATFTPEDAPAAEQLGLSQFCLHVAEPSHYSRIKGKACLSVQHPTRLRNEACKKTYKKTHTYDFKRSKAN